MDVDIVKQLHAYVDKNCVNAGVAMEYDSYIEQEVNAEPILYCEERDVDDLISLTVWDTSPAGVMSLVYTTISESYSHAVRINFNPRTQTSLHTHNYVELAIVVRGRLVQKIMGSSVSFAEGEICLVDSETLHSDILLHEDSTVFCIAIDSAFFNQFLQLDKSMQEYTRYIKQLITRKKSEYSFVRFTPKEKGAQTLHTFETIFDEMLHSRPSKIRILKGYIERLVYLLPTEYRIVLNKGEQKEFSKALFRDIVEYIDQNYTNATVQKIADTYNYSSDYISRLCSRKTGITLSQYIQKIRIEKALGLLETTTLPVGQIAQQVGYNNMGFFYKLFKEQYHTTPNKIRSK